MSVTDGTSSRLLAGPTVSVDRRATLGGFDRLKRLAALLLRAQNVVVLIDDDEADDESEAPSASIEIKAFAHHVRRRCAGGPFVEDVPSHSWLSDAMVIDGLGPVACAGVPVALADGTVAVCVCVVSGEAREWISHEEEFLR